VYAPEEVVARGHGRDRQEQAHGHRHPGGRDPADAKPTIFQIAPPRASGRAAGAGVLKDLAPGLKILANLTVCTLKGPGRCTDLWLDDESRALAARAAARGAQAVPARAWARLLDRFRRQPGRHGHRDVLRRGRSSLIKEIRIKETVAAAVAEESLRTYDQNNDVRRGPVTELKTVPPLPAAAGCRSRSSPIRCSRATVPRRFRSSLPVRCHCYPNLRFQELALVPCRMDGLHIHYCPSFHGHGSLDCSPHRSTRYHPFIIGLAVVEHCYFNQSLEWSTICLQKARETNAATYPHVWWGRAVITLGIINGGLGLQLSDTLRKRDCIRNCLCLHVVLVGGSHCSSFPPQPQQQEGETGEGMFNHEKNSSTERMNNVESGDSGPHSPVIRASSPEMFQPVEHSRRYG